MIVLAYIEAENGSAKKYSLEAVAYAKQIAQHFGGQVVAVATSSLAAANVAELGKYGADKVLHASAISGNLQGSEIADLLAQAATHTGAGAIILGKSIAADLAAPMLGVKMNASVATNAIDVPTFAGNVFKIRRSVYTGKAFADTHLEKDKKIITIKKNAAPLTESNGAAALENFAPALAQSAVEVKEIKKQTGELLLTDADIVVSGGRGMKGAEHWGIIEEIAKTLGAATGCSKPVSDIGWRPHHEHVGQTGIKVSPNLYIAIGISGAIQHLAGVNSSKTIVVVNKDPEAPFFKAADYGIIGDAFDVLPKLHEALKTALA